jgi:hypothetical protein
MPIISRDLAGEIERRSGALARDTTAVMFHL